MMDENIRLNAELVVMKMGPISGIDFGYTSESVAWLDGFVERQRLRPETDDGMIAKLVDVLGSYLGECIIKCYGGYWHNKEGQWCVCFNEGNFVYPFNKMQKQFENGAEDSIHSLFTIIPLVFPAYVR
ncbi:MAG: hypothetical protein QOE77_3649 [Blastocatellia bacterium]|jgi:hypothetical protein|nr:hypothetical protein [Blastocatellia bacterium]